MVGFTEYFLPKSRPPPGDSDAAAFGARAKNIIFIFDENRDISFASGTASNYVAQTSLANMLQQYNPDLVGGSTGSNNLLFNQEYQPSQVTVYHCTAREQGLNCAGSELCNMCNRFCWVSKIGHKCIITTISNCSCSMNFTMAFSLNHL